MPPDASFTFEVLIGLLVLLGFEFVNGFHDTANAIALAVSTGALSKKWAKIAAMLGNYTGATVGILIFGLTIAKIVGGDVVVPELLIPSVISNGVTGAALFGLCTWRLGLPTSSSNSLFGAIAGAAFGYGGHAAVRWAGILKIYEGLWVSPAIGAGFSAAANLVLAAFADRIKIPEQHFKKLQVVSAFGVAFGHGVNDGLKTVGIAMLICSTVPGLREWLVAHIWWAVNISGAVMALGSWVGSEKIAETMGYKIVSIRSQPSGAPKPSQAAVAEFVAAATLLWTTYLKKAVSTTQVTNGAISGIAIGQFVYLLIKKCFRRETDLSEVKIHLGQVCSIVGSWVLTTLVSFGIGWTLEKIRQSAGPQFESALVILAVAMLAMPARFGIKFKVRDYFEVAKK